MVNIAKLLKDAPKGTKLYSPLFGEVKFLAIDSADSTIIVETERETHEWFSACGKYKVAKSHLLYSDSDCTLFPSKDYRTWQGWTPCVAPKFKVGDKVIYNGKQHTVTFVNDKYYGFSGGVAGCRIELQDQLLSPAPKPHYDIANFNPFDKVLVRDTEGGKWNVNLFSYYIYDEDARVVAHFRCMNSLWKQCIPFNDDTKHLLGTTDQCDEQYINW